MALVSCPTYGLGGARESGAITDTAVSPVRTVVWEVAVARKQKLAVWPEWIGYDHRQVLNRTFGVRAVVTSAHQPVKI